MTTDNNEHQPTTTGNDDDPFDPVDELRRLASELWDDTRTEFREIARTELGPEADDLDELLGEVSSDAEAAIAAGDLAFLRALRHEMLTIATRRGMRVRERAALWFRGTGGRALEGVVTIAARVVSRLRERLIVLAVAGLALAAAGCALRPGVPVRGIEGLVGEVCSVYARCVGYDGEVRSEGPELAPCRELDALLDRSRRVRPDELLRPVAAVCAPLDACVDAALVEPGVAPRGNLAGEPDYRLRSYRRWCEHLSAIASGSP